jgi:peptide/nickel transport system substrate-binding protein
VARQFDLAEFAWVSSYDPAADEAYALHSRSVPTQDNFYRGGNYGNYKSGRGDQLLDYVQSSLDQGGRKAAFAELQTIWQQDLPALPLVLRPVTVAASDRLQGLRPTPAPQGETWNVEQWDLAASGP